MRIFLLLGAMSLLLAACGSQRVYFDDAAVARASYTSTEPPSITVLTMIRTENGAGGHSALLINASERIIFDPAGSFYSELVPQQEDVLYGISPRILQAYKSAHARSTYYVKSQTIEVTAEQAEIAYRLALSNGSVSKAFCTQANTALLQKVPGFEGIKSTFFPTNLSRQIAKYPGVVTDDYYEDDSPDLAASMAQANATLGQ
jgi:hypothetical protein